MTKMSRFNSAEVRQDNRLVESRFSSHMTEREQKIFAFIISETKKADLELFKENRNKQIDLSAKDFAYILKTSVTSIYRDAEALSSSIQQKRLKIKYIGSDAKEAFEEITVIPYMRYESGTLSITVNSHILKYLLDIKEKYTSFRLEHILRLGSAYAIKVYQLLKQYENSPWKSRIFTVAELKDILGLSDVKCYAQYGQFKRDVIEKSKKHINQFTDITIDYEEIKLGRSVNQLKFHIKSKITQLEMAKVAFSEFMDSLIEGSLIKSHWQDSKKNPAVQWLQFEKYFKKWIEVNCIDFHPDSIDPLQYYSKGSMFYREEENMDIIKMYHDDIRTKKSL